MSSGADCHFVEKEPGKWFYMIQVWPYGDWPEYDTHGPFPTLQKAETHLDSNYQNPGGWSVGRHPDHVHNGRIEDRYGDGERLWSCCDEEAM